MDLSDRNFYSEMLDDMKRGGEAIEDHGYEISSYGFRFGTDYGAYSDNPEDALNELLNEGRKVWWLNIEMRPSIVLDLFEEGTPRYIDESVNALLSQLRGRLNVDHPEIDELDHPLTSTKPEYHPQMTEGTFKLRWEPGGKKYAEEFIEILEKEGLNAEIHELHKDE